MVNIAYNFLVIASLILAAIVGLVVFIFMPVYIFKLFRSEFKKNLFS